MAVQGGLTLPTAREVIAAERALIQQRRGKRTGPLVGLALSGGGIRSATFNLGLLQALARHDLLERCDYLSTVSGGGYIGACLASLTATAGDVAQRNFPLAVSTEADRPEVKWVRAHSEYLAPRHGPFNVDTWRLISAYLGGLVFTLTTAAAILAVLAAAVIIIYPQIVRLLETMLDQPLTHVNELWSRPAAHPIALYLPLLTSALLWLLLQGAYAAAGSLNSDWTLKFRERMSKLQGTMLLVTALFAVTGSLPFVLAWLDTQLARAWPAISLAGILSALTVPRVFALGTQVQQLWDKIKRTVVGAGATVFVALVCLAVLYGVWKYQADALWIAAGGLLFVLAISGLTDINRISMYYFYRDRLSEAYVIRRTGDAIRSNDDVRLQSLVFADRRVPYPLINATINLPGSDDLTLHARGADFFLLSPLYCGSNVTGYCPTSEYERGRMYLASAMAVSGAAVNPQHGQGSSAALAFLMTLLNARLGVWGENPAYQPGVMGKLARPRVFWPLYLLLELFSMVNEKRALVNISDGGHIENLGAFELLRRRCDVVVISDAAADPDGTFTDLGLLTRRARMDLGVDVHISVGDLTPGRDRLTAAHVAVGEIVYPPGPKDPEPQVATLIYVKAGLTAGDPRDLHQYRAGNPSFPQQTTVDQFFDEAQFESYRELGYLSGVALGERLAAALR